MSIILKVLCLMFMVEVEMTETQEQLIRSIEQLLENLMTIDEDREYLLQNADWSGGYLYAA